MKKFPTTKGIPTTFDEIRKALQRPSISRVTNFCLGPKGTNIGQAAEQWTREIGIVDKAEIIFCDTPEDSLQAAWGVEEEVLGIFWTCAVYFKLNVLFFSNPESLPFFVVYTMNLDSMQLAIRSERMNEINGGIPQDWVISSHPSPAPLVAGWKTELVNSNSAAAQECVAGRVDACITTEQARELYDLKTVHIFGSPPMVFFGGITSEGAKLVSGF